MKKIKILSLLAIALVVVFGVTVGDAKAQITPVLPSTCPVFYPNVSFVGSPTLNLTYDSNQKENQLTSSFNISVNGGNTGAYLLYFGSVKYINQTDVSKNFAGNGTLVPTYPYFASTTKDIYGQTMYIIAPGKTGQFTLTSSVTPLQMFAGSYLASLTSLNSNVPNMNCGSSNTFTIPSNQTNSKKIVGEKSPYISSVTNPISSGQTMTIKGQRLNGGTINNDEVVYIDGQITKVEIVSQAIDGSSLAINLPTLLVGYHSIYIVNSVGPNAGKSNNVSFQVTGNTGNLPPVINGGTSPTLLAVGQSGTWTVQASDPENGPLSYSVDWGDTYTCPAGYVCTLNSPAIVQTSTFTHSYANAGTYTVKFTVTDNAGQTAQTSSTVQVGNVVPVATASAKVVPGNLELTYDTRGQEASLTAPFAMSVVAGSSDITFTDSGSFSVAYIGKGVQQNVPVNVVYINKQMPVFPFVLKAGQQAEFYIRASANPLQMFAGYYSMSVNGIYAVVNNGTQKAPITINVNNTNSVLIIGEKSPYITSVTPNPISSGQKMSISGQRLIGAMGMGNLYIDNLASTAIVDGSKDGTTLFFTLPTLTDGYHSLQVRDNVTGTGGSNYLNFQVQSTSSCYVFNTNLQIGSTGADVTALQNFLMSNGFKTEVTGYFGSLTYSSVKSYQTANGLPATGFVGPETRASMNSKCIPVVVVPKPSCTISTPTVTGTGPYSVSVPVNISSGANLGIGSEIHLYRDGSQVSYEAVRSPSNISIMDSSVPVGGSHTYTASIVSGFGTTLMKCSPARTVTVGAVPPVTPPTISTTTPPVLSTTTPIQSTKREQVRQLYITLLYRDLDPNNPSDLQGWDYWTNMSAGIDQVKAMMMTTIEYRTKQSINNLYLSLLHRQGDAQGINYWYRISEPQGFSMVPVEAGIKASAEYRSLTPVTSTTTQEASIWDAFKRLFGF